MRSGRKQDESAKICKPQEALPKQPLFRPEEGHSFWNLPPDGLLEIMDRKGYKYKKQRRVDRDDPVVEQ